MSEPRFIHLRLHTDFSLVDGLVKIKPLIKRLQQLNMPAIALTDQSNLCGLIKFYKAATGAGIKPIAGADVWVEHPEDPQHPFLLTLLVRNPNSKYRALVTPGKRGKGGKSTRKEPLEELTVTERRAAMTWMQRLKRDAYSI